MHNSQIYIYQISIMLMLFVQKEREREKKRFSMWVQNATERSKCKLNECVSVAKPQKEINWNPLV